MSYLIAVTGKGGVGKTTICALIIQSLIRNGKRPVLAIDADPNTCLDEALGVKVEKTIGAVREDAKEIAAKGIAAGISKQQLLEMKIAESLVEAQDFDLVAMGRSEGPGCYCYANNVLKSTINQIADQYPYVVLDNEAGLENLSRRIVQKVNLMVMVTDASVRGIKTVERLHSVTAEMNIKFDKLAVIVNRLRGDNLPETANQLQEKLGADFVFALNDSEEIDIFAQEAKSLTLLSENNQAVKKIDGFLGKVGIFSNK